VQGQRGDAAEGLPGAQGARGEPGRPGDIIDAAGRSVVTVNVKGEKVRK